MFDSINIVIVGLALFGTYYATFKIKTTSEQKMSRIIFIITGLAIVLLTLVAEYSRQEQAGQSQLVISNLQSTADDSLEKIGRLENMLASFLELATKKYPDLPELEALEKFKDEIKNIQLRTEELEKKTKKTTFTYIDQGRKKLPDGNYESRFTLIPIGKNSIPIFKIACKTQNNARILNFALKGKTLPPFHESGGSSDQTSTTKIFRSMEPGNIEAIISTDIDPGKLNCITNILEK